MTSTESTDQQAEQARTTNAATIAALVSLAVRDGILRPVAPTNGTGIDYVTTGTGDGIGDTDVRIGTLTKAQYGTPARVYVDVRLAHRQGQTQETTDHRQVSDWWELSISGATTTAASRRRGDVDSFGQMADLVAHTNGAPQGLPGFVKAWQAQRSLNAACDHQTPVGQDIATRLDRTPPCPVTGYRYGTAWLVRELPADAVQAVLSFIRQAKAAATG